MPGEVCQRTASKQNRGNSEVAGGADARGATRVFKKFSFISFHPPNQLLLTYSFDRYVSVIFLMPQRHGTVLCRTVLLKGIFYGKVVNA